MYIIILHIYITCQYINTITAVNAVRLAGITSIETFICSIKIVYYNRAYKSTQFVIAIAIDNFYTIK